MIDLHMWPTPNAHKVTMFLEETGLPYRTVEVNIGAGDQFEPQFLAISPNNKMPAIVDPDGPDGQPISVFESGAILIYLAEKTGRFLPAAPRERYAVLEWLMFQMASVGPMLGQAHHFRDYAPEQLPYAIDRYSNESRRIYQVVDRRLADRPYVAGRAGRHGRDPPAPARPAERRAARDPVRQETVRTALTATPTMTRRILTTAVLVLLSTAVGAELPGLRGADHIGMTVPDLAQAEAFFGRVLGCETLARNGPLSSSDDWLEKHVGVDARSRIRAMAMLRCGPGANIELFEWSAPDQDRRQPRNSDYAGHHLSFYVDDIQAAAAWLRKNGVDTYDGPFTTQDGDYRGQWVLYFRTPWGAHLELVSYPNGLGYERKGPQRLWDPRLPGRR